MPLKASTVRLQAGATLEDLPGWANLAVGDCLSEAHRLDQRIAEYDRHLAHNARADARAQRLMRLNGIAETTATALVASAGNAHEFKCGRRRLAPVVRCDRFRRVTACGDESRLDLHGMCLIMSWRRPDPSSANE